MDKPLLFDLNSVIIVPVLPLSSLLQSIERQIAHAPVEVSFSFGEDNSLLLRKAGKQSVVKFTQAELLRIRNSYFTHNHPQRGFLSAADILFAHHHNLAEMRAVAGEVVYVLSRPAAGWNETEATRLFISGNNRLASKFSHDGNMRKLLAGQQRLAETLVERLYLSVETQSL